MPPADTESVLSEGTQVGRYVVRTTIGRGGMGTVVAADDPELNRSVALKVLNPSRRRSPTELARMLREAQSLARLSHPNIVAVYDVGTFEDGIFIAMELVVGQTIGEWFDGEDQRSWREIVEAFRQAGLGLAAVHEHGLVHRDFKPANVMIDDQLRVRVADFGLARLDDGFRSTSGVRGDLPDLPDHLDSAGNFTETGTVMGTPAYMAPEQIRAGRGDARSDQFAYCVALYEALYGVNPFGREIGTKARLRRIAQRVYEPPVTQPGEPRRLRRALVRGLSYEPEDRHPSMNHLLEEIARAVRPFPRGVLVGGTVLGLATVAVTVAVAMDDDDPGEAVVCDAVTAFEGAWDADKRAEIEAAFRESGVEYWATVFPGVTQELDAYAMRWRQMYSVACEARIGGHPDLAAEQCLQDAQIQLNATTAVLSRSEAAAVERAYESVEGLRRLDRCQHGDTPGGPMDAPTDDVIAGRRALGAATAAISIGHYEEASTHIQEARRLLENVQGAPIIAEVARMDGRLLMELGRYADAERTLLEARKLGQQAGRRDIVAEATTDLLVTVGLHLGRIEDGKRYQELALQEASFSPEHYASALSSSSYFSTQLGQYAEAERDSRKALEVLASSGATAVETVKARMNLTAILRRLGKLEEARTNQDEVVTMAETTFGPAHPTTATARNNLANVLFAQGDYAGAEAEHRRVLEIRTRVLSTDHLDVAESHNNLAVILRNLGKTEESREHNAQALSIRERALGSQHPLTIQTRQNLAAANLHLGKDEEARAQLEDVIQSWTTVLGERHPELIHARRHLSVALLHQGKQDEADAQLQLAIGLAELHHGKDNPTVGKLQADRCDIALEQRDYAQAEALCLDALKAMANGLPETHPEQLTAVAALAEIELATDRVAPALARAEAAWGHVESQPSLRSSVRARVAFVLARATEDRARANELAKLAAQAYADAGPAWADAAKRVDDWLEAAQP